MIFGLNFLNAELFSNIPIGNKSSLQIASRKSLDDFVRTPTYDVYFERVIQETEADNNVENVINSNPVIYFMSENKKAGLHHWFPSPLFFSIFSVSHCV